MVRTLILTHRYVGIVTCLLFAMWFGSGMVMMYVGFPGLTAEERLRGLTPLALSAAPALAAQALAAAGVEGWPRALRMEMVLGRPAYIVHPWEGPVRTVFADDGSVLQHVEPAQAAAAAQHFGRVTRAWYLGQIEYDQWTVPNGLDPYRPLHHIALDDEASTELYVSDRTGEVVRDTTRHERVWNWCGAVLHWLYFTELRHDRAFRRQLVLWIAGVGKVSSFTGAIVGLARWRPRARYRSGRMSPYHGTIHWHHVLGLIAAVPLCTWIVSGWMSLEPGQWVSDRTIDRVMSERYTALDRPRASFTIPPATAWQAAPMVPPAKEVRLQFWEGKPLDVFASSPDHRQLISGYDRPVPVAIGGPDVMAHMAQRLLPEARIAQVVVLQAYDFYWYAHHTPRPLPVLRLRFEDPQATWLHIDPTTGEVLELLDSSRRWYRILFNALHSLDFPILLAYRPAWDLVVITLCGLGLALSVTAVTIAWRRLQTIGRS
jgi:hypothetical protein